jgi:hypothetical protein
VNRAALVLCVVLLAAAAVVVVGLRGRSPGVRLPPAGVALSYAEHVEPLVLHRCVGCHTVDEAEAGLVLEEGRGRAAMVGVPSTQVPGLLMVAPGDLEASYLWQKLEGRAAVGRGMPRTLLGWRRLPPSELEAFRRWIADGAAP